MSGRRATRGSATERTVYRSRRREEALRRRRRRLTIAAILVILAVAAATASLVAMHLRRGSEAAQTPAASPSPVTAEIPDLRDIDVVAGEKARVVYRIAASGSTTWWVTLVVTTRDGERVVAKRLATDVPAGRRETVDVLLDLAPGRYRYALEALPAGVDATGSGSGASGAARPSPSAAPVASSEAELRVLPRPFPGRADVATAFEWLGQRSGDVAAAVVDSNGDLSGYHEHRRFQTASLSKAMLLVASLRHDPSPDATTEATLTTMIEESDNASADTIFGQVGAGGLRAVAELTGMEDFEQGSGWIDCRTSAADQARFFADYESYVPAGGRSLARRLLAGITRMQRWGIPAAAGPAGWTAYHKSGWLGADNTLMVQAAWLEKGNRRWALAVLTDDNPDGSYGWDTEKGFTGLLLGRQPTAAYLSTVLEY